MYVLWKQHKNNIARYNKNEVLKELIQFLYYKNSFKTSLNKKKIKKKDFLYQRQIWKKKFKINVYFLDIKKILIIGVKKMNN